MEPSFIHLRVHSEFSIRDSLIPVKQLAKVAREQSMPALALTDHGNLFGLVKFYRAVRAQGIKPIIGADIWVKADHGHFPVTVLCQNAQGYRHLTQLISKAYLEGQTKDALPMVHWSWLAEWHNGLIVLSGGFQGDIGQAIIQGDLELAQQRLQVWLDCFGDRFYVEVSRTGHANEALYTTHILPLAYEKKVPVVATNCVCFFKKTDFEAHEARVCIQSGYVLEDTKRPKHYTDQQYFRTASEMQALFSDMPGALENTVIIAQRCNVELELGKAYLPDFPVPDGVTLDQHLEKESFDGLMNLWPLIEKEAKNPIEDYQQRLKIELDVINRMGFPGYFLIVADFIRWSKANGVPVGPGRGSGAGSLVAFVLGITMLDPLKHELLFERFLNPERVSMPDFDVDFCMEGRDRVIEYVAHQYGHEAVSQIITYGTMAAKAVVRDVGRVLSLPYGFVDKIAKLIPFEIGMTLDKALEQEEQLAERYRDDAEVTTLIDLAKKLEGLTRNAGKHAGGVVIAPTQLTDFSPLYCEPDGSDHAVTQFDKDDVEAVGLVKFDFLGLRTLTIINWAVQAINKKRISLGESCLDVDTLPLDDEKTFDLLKRCETTAVFQLESRGMKDLIRRLQPDNFEEITALVALFRPGPLQSGMVDDFIDRKHGRAQVEFPHPDSADVLSPTYGVILYQEQVMQLAQVLAGYSLGGADLLRRAMGKKKPEEMAKQRGTFTEGAKANGINEDTATYIFDLIEKFAGYGFNKSHSAAYALLAYQTAYLKAHYPAEFMAAVLSSDMDNTDKVVGFIEECKRMNLRVLPPQVNHSIYPFAVNNDGDIQYGLGAIKGAGQSAMEHLVQERQEHGPYQNLFDLTQRLDGHKVGKRVLEPLVQSGALDVFSTHRASLFLSIEKALKAASQYSRNSAQGQEDLFASSSEASSSTITVDYQDCPHWDERTVLQGEKATLGFYLSGHPLEAYLYELSQLSSLKLRNLQDQVGKTVTVSGMLIALRSLLTRKGKRMAILQLEDETARIDVTLFSKLYEAMIRDLHNDMIYVVTAKVELDDFNGGVRLVAESIDSLDQVRQTRAKRLRVMMKGGDDLTSTIVALRSSIQAMSNAQCPISVVYQHNNTQAEIQCGQRWCAAVSDADVEQIKAISGIIAVEVQY
ncbi:MAG: DNA polymerase III subunit alpha [Coxiellaceae bacterium]|nr:DNA polymerase III subunit alpha [Coxiellaceae bacterium]|tara:strand:- start:3157 stop:6606 length:3450 start_codon:yes stop_codon:yes gene_type:complete